MSTEHINSFFSKWQDLPASGDECLPHQHLVDLAHGRGNGEWSNHVQACEQCHEIFDLLKNRTIRPETMMAAFINQKKQGAEVAASVRRPTYWQYLKALLTLNRPRWNTAVLATCLLLLVGLGALSIWQLKEQRRPSELAYIERDEFFYAAETVRTATEKLPKIPLSGDRKAQRDEINKNIATVNESTTKFNELLRLKRIQGDQRGEFSSLLANYESKLVPIRLNLEARTPTQSQTISNVVTTPDGESTAQLLTAIDRVMKKKDPAHDPPATKLEQAEAIQSTLSKFEVLSIENDEDSKKVYTLLYRDPSQTSIDKTAEDKINSFADTQKMRTNFLLRRPPPSVSRTTAFSNQ